MDNFSLLRFNHSTWHVVTSDISLSPNDEMYIVGGRHDLILPLAKDTRVGNTIEIVGTKYGWRLIIPEGITVAFDTTTAGHGEYLASHSLRGCVKLVAVPDCTWQVVHCLGVLRVGKVEV